MKKRLKKIGIGILIAVISLICLCIIGIFYLFLFPKAELFGIVYAKDGTNKAYSVYEYTSDEILEINITTYRYNIEVKSTKEYENIRIYTDNNISGFVKKENSNSVVCVNYLASSKSLSVLTEEINGFFVSAGKSKITVLIPEKLISENLKININTSKKSDVTFTGRDDLILGTLAIDLYRGDVNFDYIQIKELYISAYRSNITAGKNVAGKIEKAVLDIGASTVDFTNAGNGRKVIEEQKNKENPDYSSINFDINKLYINSANRKSLIQFFKCDELLTETGCILEGGNLEVYYVGFMDVDVADFDILIVGLTDENNIGSSSFNSSGSGGLIIYNCDAQLSVVADEGDIEINKPKNVLSLETYSGNIKVVDAEQEIAVTTVYGNINISFNENAGEYSEINKVRYISSLRTKYGSVNIGGLNKINLEVESGGNANIFLDYKKVIGESAINASSANLVIVVPKDEVVGVNVTGTSAKLSVSVGTLTREYSSFEGVYSGEAYGVSGENKLLINTSGSVKLYSDNLYAMQ